MRNRFVFALLLIGTAGSGTAAVDLKDFARYGCSTPAERAEARAERRKILGILEAHGVGIADVADKTQKAADQSKDSNDLIQQMDASVEKRLSSQTRSLAMGVCLVLLAIFVGFSLLQRLVWVKLRKLNAKAQEELLHRLENGDYDDDDHENPTLA